MKNRGIETEMEFARESLWKSERVCTHNENEWTLTTWCKMSGDCETVSGVKDWVIAWVVVLAMLSVTTSQRSTGTR
jgi:hypothetical protein